jgi:hypothetical protein
MVTEVHRVEYQASTCRTSKIVQTKGEGHIPNYTFVLFFSAGMFV